MMKYIMPSIKHRGVNGVDDLRVKMAVEQWNKFKKQKSNGQNKDKKQIIALVNCFLKQIGIGVNAKFGNEWPVANGEKRTQRRISYSDIKEKSGIDHKEDIVWVKFNKSGCVSVVGVGCDIYFTQKAKDETSAGKINSFLKQLNQDENPENYEWDEGTVLVFPLINLKKLKDLDRSDIESGIGNYLIDNDVPILDYYSHNY